MHLALAVPVFTLKGKTKQTLSTPELKSDNNNHFNMNSILYNAEDCESKAYF